MTRVLTAVRAGALAGVLAFGLAACGGGEPAAPAGQAATGQPAAAASCAGQPSGAGTSSAPAKTETSPPAAAGAGQPPGGAGQPAGGAGQPAGGAGQEGQGGAGDPVKVEETPPKPDPATKTEALPSPQVSCGDPQAREDDPDGSGGVLAAVIAGLVVLCVAAGAFVFWQRRQRLAAAYAPAGGQANRPGTAPFGQGPAAAPYPPARPATPSRPAGGMGAPSRAGGAASGAGAPGRPAGQDEAGLTRALRSVAGAGISPALTQQAERLLAKPGIDRAELVQAAIRFRDQLDDRDPRLAQSLLDALRAAGVRETVVEGARVDGRLHEVVGSAPAPSPALHDTVAETTRPGYVDGTQVLRLPKVIVYKA